MYNNHTDDDGMEGFPEADDEDDDDNVRFQLVCCLLFAVFVLVCFLKMFCLLMSLISNVRSLFFYCNKKQIKSPMIILEHRCRGQNCCLIPRETMTQTEAEPTTHHGVALHTMMDCTILTDRTGIPGKSTGSKFLLPNLTYAARRWFRFFFGKNKTYERFCQRRTDEFRILLNY